MNNPTITAFHTIRAAAQLKRPPVKTIYHTDDGPIVTYAFSCILPTPFCSSWRHPIWWWKFRHWRRDILLEAKVDPALWRRMRELEDDAFLNGSGR